MPADPSTVTSPRSRWKLKGVVHQTELWSLAIGCWKGEPDGDYNRALVVRWNGDEAHRLGNPASHGNPTWFVLPDEFYGPLWGLVPSERAAQARAWLAKETDYFPP